MAAKRGATKWNAGDQLMAADLNDTFDEVSTYELAKTVTSSYTINPATERVVILKAGAAPILPDPALHAGKVIIFINYVSTITLNTTGGAAWIWIPHIASAVSSTNIWAASSTANAPECWNKYYSDGTYWIAHV